MVSSCSTIAATKHDIKTAVIIKLLVEQDSPQMVPLKKIAVEIIRLCTKSKHPIFINF
jgi:hypothetical protein